MNLGVGLLEVGFAALGVGLHGVISRLPVGGADLAMLISELEGINQAEDLIDVSADGRVVHGDVANDTLVADDEETTESVSSFLEHNSVVAGDVASEIREEGDVELASQTTFLARSVDPSKMGKVRVDGGADKLAADVVEFLSTVAEGQNLGRADESEVQRIEEKDQVLSLVIRELQGLEVLSDQSKSFEIRGLLLVAGVIRI